jgi:hypothetical protein
METDQSRNLTTVTCKGSVGVNELMKGLEDLWSGKITKNVLFDMIQGETDQFLEADILKILKFVKSIPPEQHERRRGGRTALVGLTDHVWGILRQYHAWIGTVPRSWEIQLFKDRKKAVDWILESE